MHRLCSTFTERMHWGTKMTLAIDRTNLLHVVDIEQSQTTMNNLHSIFYYYFLIHL